MPKIYRTSAESNPSCDSVWRKSNMILTDLSFNMNNSIHLIFCFYLMRICKVCCCIIIMRVSVDWLTTEHSCGYNTPTHLCIVCLYVVCASPCTNKQTRLQSTRLGENGDFKVPRQGWNMVLRKSVHPSHLVLRPSRVYDRLCVVQVHVLTADEVIRGQNVWSNLRMCSSSKVTTHS